MNVRLHLLLLVTLTYVTGCPPFECQENGLFQDPCDCRNYYSCDYGKAQKEICPSGMLWNQELEDCDLKENVHCSINPIKLAAAKPNRLLKEEVTPRDKRIAQEKANDKKSKYVSVCYFSNWSYYYKDSKKYEFDFNNLDEIISQNLCTHLVYAFANLSKTSYTIESSNPYVDLKEGNEGQDYYKKFTSLSKDVVKLLSIGGAKNSKYADYSGLVASKTKRKKFIDHVITFLKTYNFDGLDFDWEFPGENDKENFSIFLKEMKEAFNKEHKKLILTAAVKATGLENYEVSNLSKHLDYIFLMTYDFYDGYYLKADHHAKLYPDVNSSVYEWIGGNASKDKLVLGIPVYGRSFILKSSSHTTPPADATGPMKADKMTEEDGYLGYYEICQNFFNGIGTIVQDPEEHMGPYAYKDKQWVGYDDEDMAKTKAQYVKNHSLKGTMVWTLDMADVSGTCTSGAKKFPLLHAIKHVLRP